MTTQRDANPHDLCVIGGGIVGLSTAKAFLTRNAGASVLLLEKEQSPAVHQTGHNSGVVHSGIYYEPGSLKANLCRAGAVATKEFCHDHGIPINQVGKYIVATSDVEVGRLSALESRARENGIQAEFVRAEDLCRREPSIVGLAALYVPSTAIVDYSMVAAELAREIQACGAEIQYSSRVVGLREKASHVEVHTSEGRRYRARQTVVCGGLQSDRLARSAGLSPSFQVVPFRGEYFSLPRSRTALIRSLIYPVPDPALPFLGVHLTKGIDGCISVGPSAVLAWSREGYRRREIGWKDVANYATWPGFWRMASRNTGVGWSEMRGALSKGAYLRRCQVYCPQLTRADLQRRHAGIRAQVVMRDGSFAHDFVFLETERMLHVANAPSPAATSALPIGEHIVRRLSTVA